MKRLLLIGKKLPRLDSIDWPSCLTYNIVDYQGLVFDCREMRNFADEDALSNALTGYRQAGHPIFVILPTSERRNLRFFPFPIVLNVMKAPGKTLNIHNPTQPFVDYYECLQGHEIIFDVNSRQLGIEPPKTKPTIVDNLNRLVCALIPEMNVYLFHPPYRNREAQAFKILVDFFGPEFAEPEPEPVPEWASLLVSAMPGIKEIENKTADIAQRIDDLEKEADALDTQKTGNTKVGKYVCNCSHARGHRGGSNSRVRRIDAPSN